MKSGTFNFWIERDADPESFTRGTRCRWATFQIEGETCVVHSEGATLAATVRMGSDQPVTLFQIPFSPPLTRRHLVTVGWKAGRMKVLLDAKLIAEMAVEIPHSSAAVAVVPTSDAVPSVARRLSVVLLTALYPSLAHAHLSGTSAHGWLHGLAHPISGLDHIFAMIAVGLWAAQRGGRAVWQMPLTFVSLMTIGGGLGAAGFSLPLIEQGVSASVLVLGLLIAVSARFPLVSSACIVAVFALCHGYAHGVEMPQTATGYGYAAGFVVATTLLHLTGIFFAFAIARRSELPLVRWAGATIALLGVYLSLA